MSRGQLPLLRPSGQPWTPTAPAIDHPLQNIPHRILALGRRLAAGQTLTVAEEAQITSWRASHRQQLSECSWPDDSPTVKKPWVQVQ